MWAASEGASLPPLLPLGVQPLQRPPRGTHGKVAEVKVVWSNVHEPLTLHLDVRPDVVPAREHELVVQDPLGLALSRQRKEKKRGRGESDVGFREGKCWGGRPKPSKDFLPAGRTKGGASRAHCP